jgi:hypothetical protein
MTTVKLTNFEVAVIEAALQDYLQKHARTNQSQIDAATQRTKLNQVDAANAILKKISPDMFH